MSLDFSFVEKYKGLQPNWGYNGLGYFVFKRTYARLVDPQDRHLLTPDEIEFYEDAHLSIDTEEWNETILRCIKGAQKIGADYTQDEIERLFDYIFNLKGTFGGRMLWQLGTTTVDRFGGNSLLNCWYVSIRKPEDFCFIFENLMLGGGVGFSVRREHIHELPRVRKGVKITHEQSTDANFIVPDKREGWVSLLRAVLDSYFKNGRSYSYSTINIRPKGSRIKGFGGTASGPEVLVEGIHKICAILDSRSGKKLRSVDVLDLCNIIGAVVVAGNVRRSAEISIGDADDHLFLQAKRWDLYNIPAYRQNSNNTIAADTYDYIRSDVWDGYRGNGEPYGFFNLPLAQKYGRLGEYIDDQCEGLNPCGEVTLESYECCNLCEIFLNNIQTFEEFVDIAKLLYKTQKAIAALPFIHKETEEVVHRNMRLGLGVSGICQSYSKLPWLDPAYKELRNFDSEWSAHKGYPTSIKLTTVKPSGTVSLLAGATPGIHPAYSKFYIRRTTIPANSPLADACRKAGYNVDYKINIDGSYDRTSLVVDFPSMAGEGAVVKSEMTAIGQLGLVEYLQTFWADNSVSVSVYYHLSELEDIKQWLKENYENKIKAVSFLLHAEHGFKQAPYEEITEKQYNQLISNVKPVYEFIGTGVLDDLECEGGICPVR